MFKLGVLQVGIGDYNVDMMCYCLMMLLSKECWWLVVGVVKVRKMLSQ